MSLLIWKQRALPILAWLYMGLIMASWWWNTKSLIATTTVICGVILFCVASRQTWRIVLITTLILIMARWAPIPWPSQLPVLLKLAFVVLLWGQLATLLISWSLTPAMRQHARNSDQKQPYG